MAGAQTQCRVGAGSESSRESVRWRRLSVPSGAVKERSSLAGAAFPIQRECTQRDRKMRGDGKVSSDASYGERASLDQTGGHGGGGQNVLDSQAVGPGRGRAPSA